MKIHLLIALFCFNYSSYGLTNSTTKDTTVARILTQLEISKQDTFKVSLLKDLGRHLLRSNPEQSKKIALETLQLSEELDYPKGIASAYNLLALNEEHNGNYDKTIEYYFKALEILESQQDKENIANLYLNIGNVYRYQGNYEKSKAYLDKSLHLYLVLENYYGAANSYNNLGILSRDNDNLIEAVNYHKEGLNQAKKSKENRMIAVISLNLAGDLDYVKNYDLVIQSFNEALNAFINMDDKKGEAIALNNLGSAYMENEKSKLAIRFLLNSIKKAKTINFNPLIVHNYRLINIAYSDDGNYEKANEYALLLNELNDSLLNESKVKIISELETKYQTEKKEQEILLQQKEIEILEKDKKIKNYTVYGLCAFVILFILSILGWFRSYKNKKNAEEIEIRNQLDLYIKEIELLKKQSNENRPVVETIKQDLNSTLIDPLSERELEVFDELSKGKTNKEMAISLFVSVNTIKTHLKSIYEKLEVNNRTQAVKKVEELEKT